MHELWKKYRPSKLEDVMGQDEAMTVVHSLLRRGFPHATLLYGPSGCGKTSLARIVGRRLGCHEEFISEINCPSLESPVETIREIAQRMWQRPFMGDASVWIFDEVHTFSRATTAQECFLKMTEDTPEHAYFMFVSTQPEKLKVTLRNRCTGIRLHSLNDKTLETIIARVAKQENFTVSSDVMAAILQASAGSARQALVLLETATCYNTENEMLNALEAEQKNDIAWLIVKGLIYHRPTWDVMSKLVAKAQDEDQESLRHRILAVCRTCMLKADKFSQRAARVAEAFRENWYDCPNIGLTLACYEVCHGR